MADASLAPWAIVPTSAVVAAIHGPGMIPHLRDLVVAAVTVRVAPVSCASWAAQGGSRWGGRMTNLRAGAGGAQTVFTRAIDTYRQHRELSIDMLQQARTFAARLDEACEQLPQLCSLPIVPVVVASA